MSTSELHPVQWYSTEEWKTAFNLIYGPNSNEKSKREALHIMLVWKARCPLLPAGIESTLGLLEVDLQDPINEANATIPDRLLRLMYSSVIMRFINHTLDDAKSSLLQAAFRANIPEWIIQLRHETAHGQHLPSLSLFKSAAVFAMNWLLEAYWQPQSLGISNYYTEYYSFNNEGFQEDISELLSIHNLIAVLSFPALKMISISDIKDEEMKNDLLSDLKKCFPDGVVESDMSLKFALKKVVVEIKKRVKSNRHADRNLIFVNELLKSDSLFMASDIQFSDKVNKKMTTLKNKYLLAWRLILILVHVEGMIPTLLRGLLNIAEDEKEKRQKRRRAATWIKEIAQAMFKCKLSKNQFNMYIKKTSSHKELYVKLITEYPELQKDLILDLRYPVPDEICNENFIFEVLCKPHPHLHIYIHQLLQLMNPPLSDCSIKKMLQLVEIVSKSDQLMTLSDENNIHTVEDLKKNENYCSTIHENYLEPLIIDNEETVPSDMNPVDISYKNISFDSQNSGLWHRASPSFEWGKYPLGILPWQMEKNSVINPLMQMDCT